jgi:hypothetical protein
MNANALTVVIHAPTIETGLRVRLPEGTGATFPRGYF